MNNKCEQCSFYRQIDSGYGRCVRFPPVERPIDLVLGFFMLHFGYREAQYPIIPWTNATCGEFKQSHAPSPERISSK